MAMSSPDDVPPPADPTRAVYAISVAAELTGIHPQSIRSYEEHGLVEPARSAGGTRRYSDLDIARLLRISGLLGDGLNLAGIEAVLVLETLNDALRVEIARLREVLADERRDADAGGDQSPHEASSRRDTRRGR